MPARRGCCRYFPNMPETVATPVLFGAAYSVYTRICRLTLTEKGVDYELRAVDIFASTGVPPDHLRRHPFARIPAFTHGDFSIYEAAAICRYVDETFTGPALQPPTARGGARVTQIVSLLDAYAFRSLVMAIFVERIRAPQRGQVPDEARISAAIPLAERCIAAIADLLGDQTWLTGDAISLADLHAAPMMVYFTMTAEGRGIVAAHPRLAAWWCRLRARPAMRATISPLE